MKKQIITIFTVASLLWSCTDHEVETSNFELNNNSVATWKGYLKTGYFNEGTIDVKSESLIVRDGKVAAGSFTIPVSSIINSNLPTEELKEQLVHHLQSADFFDMALHPNVTFNISGVTPYSGSKEGDVAGANFMVNGSLKILGKENPIQFPAKIDVAGNLLSVEGNIKIDRTSWGMNYATDPSAPAENYIEPVIDVHLYLRGGKNNCQAP